MSAGIYGVVGFCFVILIVIHDIDGLMQDCGNSSAFAMELLQSCTKPSILFLLTSVSGSKLKKYWLSLLS